MCDGPIPIFPSGNRAGAAFPQECINQSMSGGGRRAGLEHRMERAEMREFGISGQVQKLDRLRQLQQGRRGEPEMFGQRVDGADDAGMRRMLIGIVIGRLLLLHLAGRIKRSMGEIGARWAGSWRLRGSLVEMSERQRKLDGEREQRQPRASFDVRPKPLHADGRPASKGTPDPSML